ncbi:fungal-specific transcription factor domain-containing protein [Cladorrhinum sp. PSN259]|nr:fungal-specific transcription factor domain-containing protein [Cladorrhinum sp. PSN259]
MSSGAAPSAPSASAPGPWPRQKRNQVVRACDWCRRHRTKCDNSVPCSNCRSRGAQCSNDAVKATSLPHAYREIEQLRKKVQDLELELQEERGTTSSERQSLRLPSSVCSPPELSSRGSTLESGYSDAQDIWGGVHVGTARSQHKTWYGPSSLFYFLSRFAAFLNSDLLRAQSTDHILELNPPSMLLDEPTKTSDQSGPATRTTHSEYLNLSQEEYFLDLYWQSYHTGLLPILDEADFKAYYRSLWKTDGRQRVPSPLVDIVLALCVQYGVSKEMPARRQEPAGGVDATVAGNMYYRRCQRLLAYESESPTIATMQCHLLCCIYLCCGTFQNMADSACGQAVRVAYMLGLHLDPLDTAPLGEREMRKRLWWALYMLDSKIGMKLGRPFLVYLSRSSPALPGDGFEVAMQSGSSFAPLGDDVTWLSFHLHQSKLFKATRDLHAAFYSRHIDVDSAKTIWDDVGALESQANFLKSHTAGLEQWRSEVPSALTTKRIGKSHAFATDGTILDIEPFAPLWIQRQRLLLELIYHNLCTNLYRPFISFTHNLPSSTAAGEAANQCVLHAAELTLIIHHVLSSTTILAGWYEVFQWQWNAAMTLLGFVFANPRAQSSERARTAINQAVAVFDIFSQSFAVSASASRIVRELAAKAESVVQESQRSQSQSQTQTMADTSSLLLTDMPLQNGAFVGNDTTTRSTMDDFVNFGGLLQMACDVEQWIDLGMLWPPSGEVYMDPWLEGYESTISTT